MILIVFNKSESNLQILENVKKKLLVMTLALSRIQVLPFTEEQLKLISNGGKVKNFFFDTSHIFNFHKTENKFLCSEFKLEISDTFCIC